MIAAKYKVLMLSASLVCSVVASELVLRRAKPLWSVFYPPICFQPDVFEQVAFGYRMWPDLTRRHRYPRHAPRDILLKANQQGFRSGHDFATRDGKTRIVVLGDSMVFGEGVQEEERFTELIAAAQPSWRVDNLGMIGYGPDLMLRSLEAVGLDPPPRAVLFALFTDDFRRVVEPYAGVGYAIPRFRLEDGTLVTVPYPHPLPWERSRLLQAARYAYWRYTDATFPLNGAILDRFRELANTYGFAPGIVFLPDRRDRYDDRKRRGWLAQYARHHEVPFLDLTDAIRRAGGEQLYIPDDPHWNPAGHEVVARAVLAFLLDAVLRDATPVIRPAHG